MVPFSWWRWQENRRAGLSAPLTAGQVVAGALLAGAVVQGSTVRRPPLINGVVRLRATRCR